MRTSTNVYLMSLAVCDSLYLLFCLTLSFLHCSNTDLSEEAFMYIPNAKVLSDLFSNTAVWLTVCFTLERFIAVRLPMRGKAWCTVSKAKVAILMTFIVCAVNTLPEFFETKIVEIAGNGSAHFQCETTDFAETYSYHIGYYWWFVALFTFAPLVLLAVFNSLLIKSVWQANRKRQLLSQTRVTGEANKANKEQHRVTLMLISVVLIFLVCQAPQALLLIYWSYVQANDLPYHSDMVKIAGNVCNLLVQINASVNFFLYSYFSSKFRKTFKNVICICRRYDKKRCVHRPLHHNLRGNSSSRQSITSLTLMSSPSVRSHRREIHSARREVLYKMEKL
ncbi:sex peptide receptor-like [Mya arenaria]|uniref:sex peptide receptor-like n=1 Tax=Mya arenaria TaxID=6604 RepID=UPI0022DEF4E7|nr:sex peptide receptor-like [Mya arenaria]XP_052761935.1 sex peptide receptor-like [Mya arenaria]